MADPQVNPDGAANRPVAATSRATRWLCLIVGLVLLLAGLVMAVGGLQLVALAGSWYYLLAGILLCASGLLLCRRKILSVWLFGIAYLGTIAWALWEAGFTFWPQVPRLGFFLVVGTLMAVVLSRLEPARRRLGTVLACLQVAIMVACVVAMFRPHGVIRSTAAIASPAADATLVTDDAVKQWQYYGRDSGATHYVPYEQITRANVARLKVAWTFRTGEMNDTPDLQATPLQIGDSIYFCTSHNKIFALDADTGREKWSFDPHVKADGSWNRCRGVGYFALPEAISPPQGAGQVDTACAARIIATTIDARLLALDAQTGRPCEDFGEHGIVDLKRGMGTVPPGWYYPTSAPLVARGRVIVGGWVSDNQSTDEPPGVVRAFDARTGQLTWAWDPGRPLASGLPATGATFTRSTPNFWGTATFDDELGLVFLPTGNGTPDQWGGKRSKETDTYSTSVIALDVETGQLAWHFQTVHHDLWDYDLAAPPTFVDMPDGKGGRVPALIQVGKAAQIFVLDRRTGQPVTQVEERPVPQGAAPGDRLSPTQPYSVGMPQVIPTILAEKTTWGTTFIDQLGCRIQFRKMHFEGTYTPPSTTDTPISPGYLGGMNWGGVAVDRRRDILVVNDIRLATIMRLVPHDQLAGKLQADFSHANYELHPQEGTPYGVELKSFFSFLGLPCEQPPWGMITGIDLKSRRILWQIPAGTTSEELGAETGIYAGLPMGMPTLSAATVTATGLAFYAGAMDAYIRAWDTETGAELWKADLPVGSQATPMSYVSPKTNRQYVVVVAGGSPHSERIGDYVIAYALER